MIVTARTRGWRDPTPPIQGVGARVTPRAVHIKYLRVKKRTKARTLTLTLYLTTSKTITVRVKWPGLAPGEYEEETLERP